MQIIILIVLAIICISGLLGKYQKTDNNTLHF